MAINVTTIVEQCQSALDAEGFERYEFNEDYRPAINHAVDWMVAVFNSVFSQNKLSEETLRELIRMRIFITSTYSRVHFAQADLGETIWSIVAVYPKPEYVGALVAQPNTEISVHCPLASYVKSYYSAKRTTLEKVNHDRRNPFAHGNEIDDCEETITYTYIFGVDYTGAYQVPTVHELEVQRAIPNEAIAISYLAHPQRVALVTDTIPFPEALTNMLVNKALDYISWKQGDGTNLKGVTDRDTKELITLMT